MIRLIHPPSSFQPQATITFVSASSKAQSASGNITLNVPASTQAGDLWIAVAGSAQSFNLNMSSEWTLIKLRASSGILGAWYYQYEGTTPDLSVSQNSPDSLLGSIAAFRKCKRAGNPINRINFTSYGTGTAINFYAMTPTVYGCMLLALDQGEAANNRSPIPTGFTAAFEDTEAGTQNCFKNAIGATGCSLAAHYKLHTSGSTGTLTDTQSTSVGWNSMLLAIETL